tara:strand:- start:10360 stop:10761 length:402 start_codon:yes stop_codon:yes gene_type:complete
MSNIKIELNKSFFKSSPRNPLDIPTKKLDKPLETGYEVYEWLKRNCFLTSRYAFRGRPRGKGWWDSMPLTKAERIALYIDEKPSYIIKLRQEHLRQKELQEIQDYLDELNKAMQYYESNHNQKINVKSRSNNK